jgi:radical SAM superfamily enzyme YgiQ (UPF0313 family)
MNHAVIFGLHSMMPHRFVGPHRIASYLREQGWDVEVVDFASFWTLDQLKELAKSRITSHTKFFGFGAFFGVWNDHIDEFCVWVKQNYPAVNIIYGSHTFPRFDSKGVDYYVVGYGEKAMLELARSFTGNGNKIAFDVRWFGNKKLVVANETYPSFPMNSLRVIYEDRDYIESWEWLTFEFSRGCKFSCKFCNYPILGVKEDHSRTAEDWDYQIRDAYERFGIKHYYVADETPNQDKELLEKYAKIADRFPFELRTHGFIRADLLVTHRDTWDPLIRLGFFGHMYGVETLYKKAGSAIGKGMDPEKIKEGLLAVKKHFNAIRPYRAVMNLICGLPNETKETWEAGVKWSEDEWLQTNEGVGYYALEIPIDPMDAKPSFISSNWKELGYREVESDQPKNSRASKKYAEELLSWENDHMTLKWAVEACNKAYEKNKARMGVSIWHWGDFGLITDNDLNKIQTFSKHQDLSPNGEMELFLQRYINKKLSS